MRHALLAIALLAGCATPPSGPKTTHDAFRRSTTYVGTQHQTGKLTWQFVCVDFESGQTTYLLAFRWESADWLFPGVVRFEDGTQHTAKAVDSGVMTSSVVEVYECFQVELARSWINDHRTAGTKLRVYGQRGTVDVDIPPEVFSELLAISP